MVIFNFKKISLGLLITLSLNTFNPMFGMQKEEIIQIDDDGPTVIDTESGKIEAPKVEIKQTKKEYHEESNSEIELKMYIESGRVNFKTSGKKFGTYEEQETEGLRAITISHTGKVIYLCLADDKIYNSKEKSERTCIGEFKQTSNDVEGYGVKLFFNENKEKMQEKETQTDYVTIIEDTEIKSENSSTQPVETKQEKNEQPEQSKEEKDKENINKLIKSVKQYLNPSYSDDKPKQTKKLHTVISSVIKIAEYLKDKKTNDKIFIYDVKKELLDPEINSGKSRHSKEKLVQCKNNLDEALKIDDYIELKNHDLVLDQDRYVYDAQGDLAGSWKNAPGNQIYIYTSNKSLDRPNEENISYELVWFGKDKDVAKCDNDGLYNDCNELIGIWWRDPNDNNIIKMRKHGQWIAEKIDRNNNIYDYCGTHVGVIGSEDYDKKLFEYKHPMSIRNKKDTINYDYHNDLSQTLGGANHHRNLHNISRFDSIKTEILDLEGNLRNSFGNIIGRSVKDKDGKIFIQRAAISEDKKNQNKKENPGANKNNEQPLKNEQQSANAQDNTVNKNNNNKPDIAIKYEFDFTPYQKDYCKVDDIEYIQLNVVSQGKDYEPANTCGSHAIKNTILIDEFLQTFDNEKKSLENINSELNAREYFKTVLARKDSSNEASDLENVFINQEIARLSTTKNPKLDDRATATGSLERELKSGTWDAQKKPFEAKNNYHIFTVRSGYHWYVAAIDKRGSKKRCIIMDSVNNNHINVDGPLFKQNKLLCEYMLNNISPKVPLNAETKTCPGKDEKITIINNEIRIVPKNINQFTNTGSNSKNTPIDISDDLSKQGQILTRQPLIDKQLEDIAYEASPQEVKNQIENYKNFGTVKGPDNRLAKIIILHGPNGTGKTTLGGVIARKTGREPLIVNSALLSNTYRNSAVKHLTNIFEKIAQENKPYTIIIDEADVLVRDRKDEKNGEDMDASFGLLLDSYENNTNFLFICTTNHPDLLENKFSSRLTKKIEVKKPDLNSRTRVIQNLINKLENADLDKQLTVEYIANKSDGFELRKIKNLINESYFRATRRLPQEILQNKEALRNMNFRVTLTKEDIDIEYVEVKNTTNEKTLWQNIKELDKEYGVSKTAVTSTVNGIVNTGISEAHYKFIGEQRETNSMLKGTLINAIIGLFFRRL